MTAVACPECRRPDGWRCKLPYHDQAVCWECHCRRLGADGSIEVPEPEVAVDELLGLLFEDEPFGLLDDEPEIDDRPAVSAGVTRELVELLELELGPAVCTPEFVMAADYRQTHRLEPARYRVWRWRCPACGGGRDDRLQMYRPFMVDSDGHVICEAPGCREDELEATLRQLIGGAG